MRNYELMVILHPDLDEATFTEMVERVSGWITDSGGVIGKTDIWGKRQLAYPIQKQKEGQYVLLQTQMEPSFGSELDRNMRFEESVLRYLLTSVD